MLANEQPETVVASSDVVLSEFDLQSELSGLEAETASFLNQTGNENAEDATAEVELATEEWSPSVSSSVSSSASSETTELSTALQTSDAIPQPAPLSADEKSVDVLQAERGVQVSDEAPISKLVEDLKSNDPVKRAAVLQKLARLDENEAFSLMGNLFDDPAVDVRNAAARALYDFKADRAASFTRALREGSAERRRHIAAALDGSGLANDAINSLVGESREKTYDAFSLLFLMAKAGEVQTLLQTIEKHPDVAVRLSVVRLLTFSNQPEIIPAFRSLAVRGSLPTEVRSAVMEAIYQISSNARENSLSAA